MRHTCTIVMLSGFVFGSPPQAVPDLIPGRYRIDLANPSFEFKTEDGRQSPGELIQPPKEIQIKCGCLKSPVPEPNAIERRSMATSREKN